MKLVPQSERSCFAGPLSAKKRLRAFMQLDVSIDSMISTRTALVLIQQNMMAHRLLSACPPLVRLLMTDQGPNTSSPTYVKGGQTLRRSDGRSAICCYAFVDAGRFVMQTGYAFVEY